MIEFVSKKLFCASILPKGSGGARSRAKAFCPGGLGSDPGIDLAWLFEFRIAILFGHWWTA